MGSTCLGVHMHNGQRGQTWSSSLQLVSLENKFPHAIWQNLAHRNLRFEVGNYGKEDQDQYEDFFSQGGRTKHELKGVGAPRSIPSRQSPTCITESHHPITSHYTHLTKLYSVGNLVMVVWGRCTNDTTYFCKDDTNWFEQKFSMVLEMMREEDGKRYNIPQVLAHIVAPLLFYLHHVDQF